MAANGILAGFCRLDITPPMGIYLGGYFEERQADGVLDPLYVNAAAFSDGERTAVVLACDLLGLTEPCGSSWPGQIARKLGLSEEAVFVCCTHTHTGPVVEGSRYPADPLYDEWLQKRLLDAAQLAIRDLTPVTRMLAAEQRFPRSAWVRRFMGEDGKVRTPKPQIVHELRYEASQPDETMRLVRLQREDAPELVLVNFQSHPDNIGGCRISADYPGKLREVVEQQAPGCRCIFYDGAEGQMVQWDKREKRRFKGASCAYGYGVQLAGYAMRLYHDAQPLETAGGVQFRQRILMAPTKRDPARLPEAERIIALHEAGRNDEVGPIGLQGAIYAEAYVIRSLEQQQLDEIPMKISMVTCGPLAFVGFPGEPFCEIGMAIRAASPFPVTCVCCHTNGHVGYLATAAAYDQGGYEPANSKLRKGVGELAQAVAIEGLQELAARNG